MIPPTDYYNMVRTLNTKQRHVFDYVVDWCWKFKNGQKTGETVDPFHLFLSGGGGVGKSHTLMAIYHGILHTLRDAGQDPTDVCAILTAPTGTAAFNIGGMTIHSALCLPVKEKRMKQQPYYMQLSNDKKNTLKVKLQHLRVVIIDEVSMVGAQTLISIHKRLQEIKDSKSDVPFGGVSILAVGDLLQLPPVGDSAVFSTPRDPMHRMSMSLWETLFQLEELTEVQRQRGDPTFADILNRVRVGSHTDDDMATLTSRVEDTDVDCLHIYPTNAQVDKHNQDKLEALGDSCIHISAQDEASTKSSTEKLTLPDNRYLTGGLHSRLSVALNARVSLTRNIDVSDGLVNGAVGVITHIAVRQSNLLNGTIMVKFDNNRVGLKARNMVPANLRRIPGTPIKATTCRFALGSTNALYINRTQYPLTLSWSTTIHKVQGQSLDDVTVSFQDARFTAGQAYVALSRAKSMAGLHLSSFFPEKIKVNKLALLEMERLKSSKILS